MRSIEAVNAGQATTPALPSDLRTRLADDRTTPALTQADLGGILNPPALPWLTIDYWTRGEPPECRTVSLGE